MTDAFIFGDSQTNSLKQGWDALAATGQIPAGLNVTITPLGAGYYMNTPFFKRKEDRVVFTERTYRKKIGQVPVKGFSGVYGFIANFHTIRVLRSHDWGVNAPFPLAQGEAVLSQSFVEDLFDADQRHMLAFLDEMKAVGLEVFAIETPRPFRHHPMFESARPEVLIGLDRMYRSYIRRALEARGIAIVPVPPSVLDADGLMRPDFRHPNPQDKHHANEAYGQVMAREVAAYLQDRG